MPGAECHGVRLEACVTAADCAIAVELAVLLAVGSYGCAHMERGRGGGGEGGGYGVQIDVLQEIIHNCPTAVTKVKWDGQAGQQTTGQVCLLT